MHTKNIYIKTWGCQMNEYDSSMIVTLLQKKNKYLFTKSAENADILILNTCSIREKAQEKVFHQLGRWKKLKNNNPQVIIAVGGCVATQEGKEIFKRANYVDIIFGTQTLHRLPNMISEVEKKRKLSIDISFPKLEKFKYSLEPKKKGYTADISIMEGCNKYCSFCVVPYTRGNEISRPCDDVLFEISILAKQGVREINLLGQNVNAYQGPTFNGKICYFSELIRLVAEIDGIDRIRFTTSNPLEFTDDIIEVYQDTPKLASFLHLPVQSGSNKILNLMKRSYTIEDYQSIVKKLIIARPNIQISSDFIVGFPGESEIDFQQTMSFIKNINFDMSFSFIYSNRPGTPASQMEDYLDIKEKKRRLYLLQNLINIQTMLWSRKMFGSVQSILVEGVSDKNIMHLYGRTENNRIVTFEGSPKMIGEFVDVKIEKIHTHSLKGKLF
ncbi:isopentenyl-adenosine A37 tRNA methylthiolase [Buchnera aphidicola str. Ak (Acyrthosiphon kondoi)]|uniref:tRNA-2-methylthio-N(6)-dimethylallyladenosine synthase n=1 Tax=Buchnera aphidicola str. Ak (Acyrthosiphon kondoi) TaxID=1005090 RepID=G2LNE1_9GAMM|nr:tRNA (N6-isopentenyl adenosine(37)-C2)-methylthiotransferase MiaB [Buchnera aphidicola]AEO08779.1 isopentenyl-adenosine A37 tRNA methylthiolase [Buchnera aphidicola str. Ak (Acyrthosiphon kondoi)]WAI18417.1 MAG: tRNA (N6-isopentenyl adenosine(37)-C2)-methylthiotransferase MiaB [Buchnera aphidicola (Acyrthosiphon caraganae)]